MNLPQVIEVRGIRVLTTKQLAELYGTDPERIKLNYRYNKERYIVGKHIIPIEDAELREFKARYQFNTSFKYAKSLYLWTEKGALLHAKSLNTDKAWEVYDYLVDFYFRAKEKVVEPEKKEIVPAEVREDTQNSKIPPKDIDKKSLNIAPMFRQVLTMLPTDALDEMERSFRSSKAQAVKLAAVSILAEKMKRELAE